MGKNKNPRSWIAEYKKIDDLGKGGNGSVFLVQSAKDSNKYALKELESVKDSEKKDRFKNEINLTIKYQNEIQGILPVINYDFDDCWYTMPIAVPINKYLDNIGRDVICIVEGVHSLATTLQRLHKDNISHRDIKPDNIYFYDNRYTLGDFGLATSLDNDANITKDNRGLGARFTIAPEMKRHPKEADGTKADVFSLAKTLWMLIRSDNLAFDGVYSSSDRSLGLRFYEKSRGMHLVEIEKLLTFATDNDPELRPTMAEFILELNVWLDVIKNENKQHESQWNYLEQVLFSDYVPKETEWTQLDALIKVLNTSASFPVLSHLLFSDGGGLDFASAEMANEDGCIYIIDTLGYTSLVKPKSLTIEIFSSDSRWNYFFLELEELDMIFPDNCYEEISYEYIVEDNPGHYVKADDAMYGVYDYDTGEPFPEGYKTVHRYLRGNFLLVLKSSPYNGLSQTYSGNHSLLSNDEFSGYMGALKSVYDAPQLEDLDEHQKEIVLNKMAQKMDKQYAPEKEFVFSRDFEEEQFLKKRIKESFMSWVFELSEQQEQESLIRFCFELQTTNGGDMGALIDAYFTHYFLTRDKHFVTNPESNNIFYLYTREDALDLREKLLLKIQKVTETTKGMLQEIGLDVTIEIERTGNPSHLFTKDEISSLMEGADDRKGNTLVIDENGYAKMITGFNEATHIELRTYPVHLESWDSRNNYVGKYSALSSLEYTFIMALLGWEKYLETGCNQKVDYIDPLKLEGLQDKIKEYYKS